MTIVCRVLGVRCRRVAQDPEDLAFRQDFPIVQCQKQRFADGQRGRPRNVRRRGAGDRVAMGMGGPLLA